MKKLIIIQLKAAFLMIVFSLNTVIGFACAVGIDMGFNKPHHYNEKTAQVSVHVHADGKKHIHHKETENVNVKATHHHGTENANTKVNHHNSKDDKENCCNEEVTKFSQLDKSLPQSLKSAANPLFFIALVSSFYNSDILFYSQITPHIKYFVRSYHPPISDIRIAIQSFQI